MKETPIIMSGNHPKLVLDGLKTQTRRVIKPQPTKYGDPPWNWKYRNVTMSRVYASSLKRDLPFYCPYGQVGDRLWVKETWATEQRLNHLKPSEIGNASEVPLWYKFDTNPVYERTNYLEDLVTRGKWRSSRFMPRWASRITLEITEVRVERINDISEEDTRAEGFVSTSMFHETWDFLNAKRSYGWEVNPWVWVISFRRINNVYNSQ